MQLSVFVKLRSFYILQLNQLHYDWNCAKMIYVGSDLYRPQIMNANGYLVFFQYIWPANESAIQPIMAIWKETWWQPTTWIKPKKIPKLPKKLKMNIFVFRSFLLIFQFILDIQCFNWFNANDYFKLIKVPKATHIQADDDDDYECIFFSSLKSPTLSTYYNNRYSDWTEW